jgi:hypothetical protein
VENVQTQQPRPLGSAFCSLYRILLHLILFNVVSGYF